MALPTAAETCRVALNTPEPAPTTSGARSEVAVSETGDQIMALPSPITSVSAASSHTEVPGRRLRAYAASPAAMMSIPGSAMLRGATRPSARPTKGARTAESRDMGA